MVFGVTDKEVGQPLDYGLSALAEDIERHISIRGAKLRKQAICVLGDAQELDRESLGNFRGQLANFDDELAVCWLAPSVRPIIQIDYFLYYILVRDQGGSPVLM